VEANTLRAPLLAWMLKADDPAEVLLVCEVLRPHNEELRERLWALAEEAGTPAAVRLRALTALAAYDPENARWGKAGGTAAELLLTADPFYRGAPPDGGASAGRVRWRRSKTVTASGKTNGGLPSS